MVRGAFGAWLGGGTIGRGVIGVSGCSCTAGNVRVAFGITVLLKRSLLGFSNGATGVASAAERSFLVNVWSLTFLNRFRNGIVMVI